MRKPLTKIIAIIFILLSLAMPIYARAEDDAEQLPITSAGAIVIDFETGEDIYTYNADVRHNPASMTKMMTVYLVYEAIANGDITFETTVPVSARVMEYTRDPAWTNAPMSQTGTYTVEELIDVVIAISAGNAAIALAELVGGTENAFVRRMNEKAEAWGIDAYFQTPSGGPADTYVTPRAMAEIVRHTAQDYPEVLDKTSKRQVVFKGQTFTSTNLLLDVYEGIDGFKTGTNAFSKENFSATAQRGDVRIISVTMGSNYGSRFDDTTVLLDYGFAVMEERLEERRIEHERHEAERLEAERLEAERIEAERLEAERLEEERLEAERLETERLEAERLEAERLEAERLQEQQENDAEALINEAQKESISSTAITVIITILLVLIVAVGAIAKRRFPKGKRER